jgi:hypothetical protein
MIAKSKRKSDQDQIDRERARLEQALDDALENTFPASDPISAEQPVGAEPLGTPALDPLP